MLHRVFLSLCLLPACFNAAFAQSSASNAVSPDTVSWLQPTNELNSNLPYWLRFHGEERVRAEGVDGLAYSDNGDGYLLNRFRFSMEVLPKDWLKFNFQVQDARAFGKNGVPAPPYQDTWDLRMAYVEVGDVEKYHAALRIGRQVLAFGDERLIGPSDFTNTTRTFDAYRATIQKGKYTLDAFAASVVVLQDGQVGQHTPGNYIEGLYGQLKNVLPHSTIQPYFLWRRNPLQKTGNGHLANEDFGTTGVRWVGTLPAGFDYNSETAVQRGSLGTDHVAAWAQHLAIGYLLPTARLKSTRYIVEYNFASGDQNSKDNVHGTFDTLYASGHDKIELADQVGWKNIQEIRTGPEVKLSPKWKAYFKYSDFWLANAHDALYSSSGAAVVRRSDGSAGRWIGQEFDATSAYSPRHDSTIGAGFAYLLPGTFLKLTTPGHTYTYPYLFYSTTF